MTSCDCALCKGRRFDARGYFDRLRTEQAEYRREKERKQKELDEQVQGLYRDYRNGGYEWQSGLPASWNAERAIPRNGSSACTTTPQRKACSPTAGGATPERFTPMEKDTLPQPKKLMMAGDWHGQLPWAFKAIHYAASQGVDTILHVGDFGWWRACPATWQFLCEVQKELAKFRIELLWVDGNHEDHSFWNSFNQPGAKPVTVMSYPNITHLPRGYRWEWWGDVWMAVGGAFSVDRSFGVEGETWWQGETLSTEQIEYCQRPGRVDIIVSHDCPGGVPIPGIDPDKDIWLYIDGKARRVPTRHKLAANHHRADLRSIVDAVKPSELYHGHYHKAHNTGVRMSADHYLNVTGLDKDNTTMAKNTVIIEGGLNDEDWVDES